MKTILLSLIALAFSLGANAQKQLVILHTNDTHSCVMPLNANLADTAVAGRGGYLRRLALIEEERRQSPDLLLFDSGDFSQGSPYYTLFKGIVEVGLMSRMQYDAATIGNHEFDYGLDNMAVVFSMARFPIVCANYDFRGTPVEPYVKPYVILRRQGMRIGVFGLSPQLEGLVDMSKCQGVKYLDPFETANRVAAELKHKEKCDLVICLSHLGWDEQGDIRLIRGSRDIDLVLGGHSHTYFEQLRNVENADGRSIGVDQNGKSGIWIGRLVLDMKKR